MDILVAGGTGFIGTALCEALVDRGHDVTALARDPTDAELPPAVDRVEGDVTKGKTLDEPLTGIDTVVNLVALSPLRIPSGGERMHDRIHRRGTRNLVKRSEDASVQRFVQMSALGADPNAPTKYLQAKGQAENAVRDGEFEWTIFRPSVVFGDGGEFVSFTRRLTPPVVAPLPGGGQTKFQPIWVGDLVDMIAEATTNDDHTGEVYEIGGPNVLSLAKIAKMVRRARGQRTRIIPVPMGLAKAGLSVMGIVPGFPFGRDQYRSLTIDNVVKDNDVTAFDREPTELRTLADYLGVSSPDREDPDTADA